MSLSLYEISDKYRSVLSELESIDDLDAETVENTMAVFKDDLDKKCLSVAAFIKNLDAEAKAMKDAEEGIAARRKAVEAKVSRMRDYLAAHLPGKLKDAQTSITPLKGREKIVVDNIDLLPESCIKVTRSAISAEVKKYFDDLPEGAARKEVGPVSVMIR